MRLKLTLCRYSANDVVSPINLVNFVKYCYQNKGKQKSYHVNPINCTDFKRGRIKRLLYHEFISETDIYSNRKSQYDISKTSRA